jgi:PAS domain S-box-containing protein
MGNEHELTLEARVAERTAELIQANARMEQALLHAQVLQRVGAALLEFERLDDAMQQAVDLVAAMLDVDRVTLITFDLAQRMVTGFHVSGQLTTNVVRVDFDELWDGLSGWVLREMMPALSPKGFPDPRESPAVQQRRVDTHCGAIVVAPVVFKGTALGTITIINKPEQRDFDQQDVNLLLALANQIAAALENNRLYLAMAAEVQERRRTEAALQQAYAQVEQTVAERTAALTLANQALEGEIAERKKSDDSLRRSEENLNRAQAVAHTGSWVLDVPNNRLEWSQETYRIFGLPEGAAVHQDDFMACVHPEDRAAATAAWVAALHGAAYAIEHRIIANGVVKWVRETAELVYDAAGQPVQAVGVAQDITAQKQAEVALRASEERHRAIFEGANEGIVAVNLNRNAFAFVNPAMCALFGYTQEEFLGLLMPDLHPEDDLPQVLTEFGALTRGEKATVTSIPCRRKDGARFYADIKATVAAIGGEPHAIAFFRDATVRYRSDALLQARLRLSTLAPDCSLDELLRMTLDETEIVTSSQIGYVHFLDDDAANVTLQQWSTNTVGERCTAEGKGHTYAIAEAGVWAECVRERKAKIYNDYGRLPQRRELPAGHAPVNRLLSAPVQRDGKVVALIGVADKATDYDQQDVDAAVLLATEAWDIILRKRAEAAQRASEERYRILIESQESIIATIDAEGRHHYMNQIGAALLQRDLSEIVGKTLHDLFPPAEADRLLRNVRQVIASGQGMVEESATSWDGRVRWNRTNIQPLRDAAGKVTLALINAVDITERKATELVLEDRVRRRTAEIESMRQRLALATRSANIGIWDWNCKSGEMIWDDQMLRLYGVTRADFDGTVKSWERGVHPDDLPAQWVHAQAALRNEREFDTEFRVVWPDGSVHHLKANALVLFDAQGQAERMIGVNYDITVIRQAELLAHLSEETLRRANQELERAVRIKDDFLASMSHELRTPLTGILGLSEVLQYAAFGELTEKQRRAVANIESSGHHLLDLINDILDISKIEADKLQLQLEPCSLDDICHASLQLVKGMAQHKRQNVQFAMSPTGVTLKCDMRRLKQILVNLLSNAVKFTPEGGALGLEVAGDEPGQIIRLTVWDKGVGIPQDDLTKLFQPFVQLDSSLARQQTGTGLGLALVARLAALHGGSVTVESTPGVGSRFTVALPWAQTQSAAPLLDQMDGGPLVERVMTVEDNEMDAARLTRMLKAMGIEHLVHSRGQGVLERVLELQPNVILLDLNLPDRSGWDVLSELKADERTRTIPIIITSVADDRAKADALGAASSLVKPVTPADLRAALERTQVKVPASEPVFAITAAAADSPVVMVVDDNQINIETVGDFLEASGFRVAPANSGWECLEQAPTIHPDLIMMDIQMPGIDGLETIRRLRRHADLQLAATPIIAVTALAMKGDRERCLEAGANEYMSKPMRMNVMVETIRGLLEHQEDVLTR